MFAYTMARRQRGTLLQSATQSQQQTMGDERDTYVMKSIQTNFKAARFSRSSDSSASDVTLIK